ncbi:MAG: hypothetical protein GKR94_11445 [Gammaproteobacteria bacterium]|nr:hypothetical protein [Gammaproteobacteria bacterium]
MTKAPTAKAPATKDNTAADNSTVRLGKSAAVATLTCDRPKAPKAMTRTLYDAMAVTEPTAARLPDARAAPDDDLATRAYGSSDLHQGIAALTAQRPVVWSSA